MSNSSNEGLAQPNTNVGELHLVKSGEVAVDKRKTVSKFNAFKHGKRARTLPLLCDHCNYRPEEKGGGGQCQYYKTGAVCSLSTEFEKYWKQFDTRDPKQLTAMNEVLLQRQLTKIWIAEQMSAWDGGVPDKVLDRQIHVYLELMKMHKELVMPRVMAKQTTIEENTHDGTVRTMMQELFMSASQGREPKEIAEPTADDKELADLDDGESDNEEVSE